MRRPNLWADAKEKVQSIVRHSAPGDQLALFAFDRNVRPLMSFDQWNATSLGDRGAVALRALSDTAPGWGATRLDAALLRGAEILADTSTKQTPGPGEIILVSDLQEGSHLEFLQGSEWPRNVHVSVDLLKPRHGSNASLQLVTESQDADSRGPGEIRIRISNAADSKRDQFKVGWFRTDGFGFEGNPAEVYVPPGQNRVVAFPSSTNGAALSRVLLQGDEEDFDNSLYVLPPETVWRNVLYVGADSPTDPKQPLYFLNRAFQETRREVVQVRAQAPNLPVSDADQKSADMIIIGGSLPAGEAEAFRNFAADGKTVLFVLGDRAGAQTLAGLLGVNELSVTEGQPANYAMLGEVDLRDPLFAPFADPRFSDFTGIHFWKYRRVDLKSVPQARTLARFDSQDPAMFEVPVGKGRVLVLTSGWSPRDSQLALSTKFVPLLYSLLETSTESSPGSTRYFVGDSVPVTSVPGTSSKILTPENKEVELVAGETNFSATLMPGVYSVTSGQTVTRFAVNLDPSESRTAPLSVDDLEHLGVPLKHTEIPGGIAAQRNIRLKNADLENQQKLWRWLIACAVAVLLVETWLAGRLQQRAMSTVELRPGLEHDPGDHERVPVSAIW
jgi:hypothetical protein